MFETIAMFGGIIGGVVAILSIIVFFLLKKNVINILNKDAILFDKNFEIKLNVLNECMSLIDELELKGKSLTIDAKFEQLARMCYNKLLCVVTEIKLADEFYALTLDKEVPFDATRLAEFKLHCRKDIGFKINKSLLVARSKKPTGVGPNEALMRANATNNNSNPYQNSDYNPNQSNTNVVNQQATPNEQ